MKWRESLLSNLIELENGYAFKSDEYTDEGHFLMRIANVQQGYISTQSPKFVSIPARSNLNQYELNDGDMLMSLTGNVGRVGFIEKHHLPAALNQRVARIKIKDEKEIDKRYLFNFFHNETTREKIEKLANGAAQLNVSTKDIKSLSIPLPPLAEQKRIAELLDTADNIMRLREQAIAKLDELVLSKFSEIEVNVKEHIELEKIVVKPKVESKLTSEKVWSLSLDQIESQTGKLIDKVFVDKNDLGTSTFFFKPPVVLYSKLRPYLNKVYIPDSEGYATTELIPLYCNKDLVLPEYLALMLMSKKFVEYATVNSGGAKMPRMMMDKFWNYPVPLANMSVQQNIAKIYNQIKSAKKVMELDLQKLHNLNSSLQHQTFAVN